MLRRAVEQTQRSGPAAIGILLAEKMSQYANLLASQGSLSTAITYLPDNTNQVGKQHPSVVVCFFHKAAAVIPHSFLSCCFVPCRLPYSSSVTASVGLWGSSSRRWRLRCSHRELRLLSHLHPGPHRLCSGIRSPRRSPPWCLSPLQLPLCPCSHLPLPRHLHSHSITSRYV